MKKFRKLVAIIAAITLLCTVFASLGIDALAATDVRELKEFRAHMAERKTLTPGTLDTMGTDDYVFRMFRTRAADYYAFPLAADEHEVQKGTKPYYKVSKSSDLAGWGRVAQGGDLFEIPNDYVMHYAYDQYRACMGLSAVYNVVGNTYVGTGVVTAYTNNLDNTRVDVSTEEKWRAAGYQYQVSVDGSVWVDISDTVTYTGIDIGGTTDNNYWNRHHLQHAWATAYIPNGYNYYRITLPAISDAARASTDLRTESTYSSVQPPQDNQIKSFYGYGIGSSLCSAFDLSQVTFTVGTAENPKTYDAYKQIPDYGTNLTTRQKNWFTSMASKKTLIPGTHSDMSTDEYVTFEWRQDTSSAYFASNPISKRMVKHTLSDYAELDALPHAFGSLYGHKNQNAWVFNTSNDQYPGPTAYFNVVGGTKVAVSMIMNAATCKVDYQTFYTANCQYQTSADGLNWQSLTPTITYTGTGRVDGVSRYAEAVIVAQIPTGHRYYRVTFSVPTECVAKLENTLFGSTSGWASGETNILYNGCADYFSITAGITGAYAAPADFDLANYAGTYENLPREYSITVPSGITASKKYASAEGEEILLTVDEGKTLVAGSLKANGVPLFTKGDSTVPGEGTGRVYALSMPAEDVTVTAEFKAASELTAEDNFATIAASANTQDDVRALRFLTRFYTKDGKIQIDGKSYNIITAGTLMLPKRMLGDAELSINTASAINSQVNCLYDRTDNYIDFTCGIKNLSPRLQVDNIVARAYVTYLDENGDTQYAYAAPVYTSFEKIGGKLVTGTDAPAYPAATTIGAKIEAADEYNIVFVGDSITYGTGITSTMGNTYSAEVAKALAAKYADRTVIRYDGNYVAQGEPLNGYTATTVQTGTGGKTISVFKSGVPSDRTSTALKRKHNFIGELADGKKADAIVFQLGVNDSSYHTLAEYEANLRQLIADIKEAQPETDIIMMTPTGVTTGAEAQVNLDEHSAVMKMLAMEYGLPVIDFHSVWASKYQQGSYHYGMGDYLFANDNYHPTTMGHQLMADTIMDNLY